MALAPSLAVDSFHTLRRKAKAPWEQAPKGLQITEPDRSPKLRDNALFHHRPRRKPPHSPSVFVRSLKYTDIAKFADVLTDRPKEISGITLRGQPGWGENMAYIDTLVNTFGGTW